MPSYSTWLARRRSRQSGWAALPGDILVDIFHRLGPREVMLGAEFVCSWWRRVALEEPSLWRRVGMDDVLDPWRRRVGWDAEVAMKRAAVARSAGQCEAFGGYFGDDSPFVSLVLESAPSVKCLKISHYSDDESAEMLIEALKKLPLLEELQIKFTYMIDSEENMLQSVCQACPHLKELVLCYASAFDLECNEHGSLKEPIDGDIPMMHELRVLEISECDLSCKGLRSILDSCPQLETLDIDGYFDKREMDDELRAKCSRVKNLILETCKKPLKSDEDSDEDYP
ncbi:unnamed protein product [Urochloa decumbens]|uniref:F-box domain-containing protein n=1 Tax=Urochloa decumbens TaxID=240449 RepID=A0ABC9BA90_9POAL